MLPRSPPSAVRSTETVRRGGVVVMAALAALVVADTACADSTSRTRTAGALRSAIPLATLGTEWLRGERDGAVQYAMALGVGLAATETLKRTVRKERPDGTDDRAFPSGHATAAFSAASYVHRRYGLYEAAPLYLLGAYVGHLRVQAGAHRWADIAGSLAVTTASSWWLVSPRGDARVSVVPALGHRHVGVVLAAAW